MIVCVQTYNFCKFLERCVYFIWKRRLVKSSGKIIKIIFVYFLFLYLPPYYGGTAIQVRENIKCARVPLDLGPSSVFVLGS